jgi:hypothetical protein
LEICGEDHQGHKTRRSASAGPPLNLSKSLPTSIQEVGSTKTQSASAEQDGSRGHRQPETLATGHADVVAMIKKGHSPRQSATRPLLQPDAVDLSRHKRQEYDSDNKRIRQTDHDYSGSKDIHATDDPGTSEPTPTKQINRLRRLETPHVQVHAKLAVDESHSQGLSRSS